MSMDWVTNPISEDAPCGPNLDLSDDEEFVDYYFDALGRIPERYVKPGMATEGGKRTEDQAFDPKSIDIKSESKTILGLLERSRDIRLLVLLAQLECLAGRPVQMADAIEAIADLIETFGNEAHPAIEGDVSDRRETLSDLAQPVAIVTALRYVGLIGKTDVTLRKLQVASGQSTPNTGEDDLSQSMMESELGSPGNRKPVDDVHDAILRMSASLNRILTSCKLNETQPFSPPLGPTLAVLDEMRDVITSARPDLRGAEADLDSAPETVAGDDAPAETDAGASSAAPQVAAPAPLPETAVKNHAEAQQALLAVERYFQNNEPSSAALLLVRQSRHLIGVPLIDALEILLPEQCAQAKVAFGPQTGFVIPAMRLKALSDDRIATAQDGQPEADLPPPPEISNGAQVGAVVKGVEDFFRAREKSSPIPILLQRARSYLDKDFQALVDELISGSGQ